MRHHQTAALLVLALAPFVGCQEGRRTGQVLPVQAAPAPPPGPVNGGPVITTSIGSGTSTYVYDTVSFTVTATDPEGDAITLSCVNPPPGADIGTAIAQPSPATISVRWVIPNACVGLNQLCFRAADSGTPSRVTTRSIAISATGAAFPVGHVVADVTGDGTMDLIARASEADVAGVVDAGAVYVWAGRATPSGTPTATLTVAAAGGDRLGYADLRAQALHCVDVTGDGILDVVVAASSTDNGYTLDVGAIHVWAGGSGLRGTPAPTASLSVPGASAGTWLGAMVANSGGFMWCQGLYCHDVTGDGVSDIFATSPYADVNGISRCGAIYLWVGGSGLSGTLAPTSTLAPPSPGAGDFMGTFTVCADVTGDGKRDIVTIAIFADAGGVVDSGAIYVWAGRTTFSSSSTAPTATLTVANAVTGDNLGRIWYREALQVVDVTGDGVLDVVSGSPFADIGGKIDSGALYAWAGGSGLTGSVTPTATMTIPNPVFGELLGRNFWGGRAVMCHDLTGDGVVDILATGGVPYTGGGVAYSAVYLFAGGSTLTGAVGPTATFRDATAPQFPRDERYVSTIPFYSEGMRCADVSGDGTNDLLVTSTSAVDPVTGAGATGAIYIWFGGSSLTGTPTASATLRISGAQQSTRFGSSGVHFAEVTGDSQIDIITGSCFWGTGGVYFKGAIWVWAGGSTLTGSPAPTASLTVPGAIYGDGLTAHWDWDALLCRDVTGDGVRDIVGTACFATVGGTSNTGAVYVWRGGTTLSGALSPQATLTVAGAAAMDRLGETRGQSVRCGDVTGDGVLDILAGAMAADVGGVTDAGALYVWVGGAGLTGSINPNATLYVPGASSGDRLGDGGGRTVECVDLNGDGVLDVLGVAMSADIGGTADVGALYFWTWGTGLTGAVAPNATFAVAAAQAGDGLGK